MPMSRVVCNGVLYRIMMPRVKGKTDALVLVPSGKLHLKEVGIGGIMHALYKTAVRRFFVFVMLCVPKKPSSLSEFRWAASEFVIFLVPGRRAAVLGKHVYYGNEEVLSRSPRWFRLGCQVLPQLEESYCRSEVLPVHYRDDPSDGLDGYYGE